MTAQPIRSTGVAARWPGLDQRLATHTIEDVLALPDDAPRIDFRDGVMIVVPSHYELGSDGRYRLAADSAIELVLDKPFEGRLPIGEITP